MSDISDLIKKFEKVRDLFEAAEIVEKIQEVINRLKAGEPTALVVARLLAELVEELGDKLGPLGPAITAYVKLFRAAITSLLGSVYGRYKAARDSGVEHEVAGPNITGDKQAAEFLRLTYALEKRKEAEEKKKKAEEAAKEAEKKAKGDTSARAEEVRTRVRATLARAEATKRRRPRRAR